MAEEESSSGYLIYSKQDSTIKDNEGEPLTHPPMAPKGFPRESSHHSDRQVNVCEFVDIQGEPQDNVEVALVKVASVNTKKRQAPRKSEHTLMWQWHYALSKSKKEIESPVMWLLISPDSKVRIDSIFKQ